MIAAPVSVIVVSRGRPDDLTRCLVALSQQDHPCLEVVVVADAAGLAAAARTGLVLKTAPCEVANISAARNIGLALAAGEVVAFIDDDACAEPTWASRLAAPFEDARVTQAGGFVRGRNGISFQWKAMEVDRLGTDHPLVVPEDRVSLHVGSAERAVKTVGTNCAFRASALHEAGGFDEAFRFFLDEADVNLRLAARGGLTAIVPLAQVQHGFAASARRRADRVPLSLYEIGASTAVFLRRHAPEAAGSLPQPVWRRERARLWRHMLRGRIGPVTLWRLMTGLRAGWAEGLSRDFAPVSDWGHARALLPMPGVGPKPGLFLLAQAGTPAARDAEDRAAAEAAEGRIVTLLKLAPGFRRHRAGFSSRGFWWQEGGRAGRSDRDGPLHVTVSPAERAELERIRLSPIRPVGNLYR